MIQRLIAACALAFILAVAVASPLSAFAKDAPAPATPNMASQRAPTATLSNQAVAAINARIAALEPIKAAIEADRRAQGALNSERRGLRALRSLLNLMPLNRSNPMSRTDALLIVRMAVDMSDLLRTSALPRLLAEFKDAAGASRILSSAPDLFATCRSEQDGFSADGDFPEATDAGRGQALVGQDELGVYYSIETPVRAREACQLKNLIMSGMNRRDDR